MGRESLRKMKPAMFVAFAVCVLLMQTIPAKAEEAPKTTIDKVGYILNVENMTAQVGAYVEKSNIAHTEVIIPSQIPYEGMKYTVTSIASGAFSSSSYIEKIEIPATVTEIGTYAFSGCVALKEVNLPVGLKKVSEAVFCDCDSLEAIDIPATVTVIEPAAFLGCEKLKRVIIPNGVTELGTCCFCNCYSLEEIIIPNSVKKMDDAVLLGCAALTQVVIPESVESVPSSILLSCDNLESFFYPSHLKDIFLVDDYEDTAQISYVINADGTVSLTVENLPEGVTGIDLPTDIGGHEIVSVTGPEGVSIPVTCSKHHFNSYSKDAKEHWATCALCKKEIRDSHVFASGSQPCVCSYVPFAISAQPKGISFSYGKSANLSVTVKATFGKEKIAYQWMENGSVITGATASSYKIPKRKPVGNYTYTCKVTCGGYSKGTAAAVVTIQAPAKGKKYKDDTNMATYKVTKARMDGKATVEYVKPVNKKKSTVIIPATVKIGGVTYKVTSIAKNAFKGNKNIKRLTIEKNVEKIGAKAFFGCKKLKNITIRTTKLKAKKVGANAFANIKSNATVKVPKKKMKVYKSMLTKKGMSSKVKFRKS